MIEFTWSCPYPDCDALLPCVTESPDRCPKCMRAPIKVSQDASLTSEHGWFCPIHGYYLVDAPEACLANHCTRYRRLTHSERFTYLTKNRDEPGMAPLLREMVDKGPSILKQDYYNWHPSGVECKDIAAPFPFNLGAAIKYIWRAGRKDHRTQIEDLEKARNHVQFEIDRLKADP